MYCNASVLPLLFFGSQYIRTQEWRVNNDIDHVLEREVSFLCFFIMSVSMNLVSKCASSQITYMY